jgi:hypothetical protein
LQPGKDFFASGGGLHRVTLLDKVALEQMADAGVVINNQ